MQTHIPPPMSSLQMRIVIVYVTFLYLSQIWVGWRIPQLNNVILFNIFDGDSPNNVSLLNQYKYPPARFCSTTILNSDDKKPIVFNMTKEVNVT